MYSCIWPVFWPHALMKVFLMKSQNYVDINGHKLDRNSFVAHFVPISGLEYREIIENVNEDSNFGRKTQASTIF